MSDELSRRFFFACRDRNAKVVKELAYNPEVDLNFRSAFSNGETAFAMACALGDYDLVDFLISLPGVDVNAPNNWNKTPLMYACIEIHYEIIRLLLSDPRVDVAAMDKFDNTALLCACSYKRYLYSCNFREDNYSEEAHRKVISMLLSHPEVKVTPKIQGQMPRYPDWLRAVLQEKLDAATEEEVREAIEAKLNISTPKAEAGEGSE